MQQFIEFSLRHWELWLAFFVILILLLTFELHAKLTGTLPLSVQEAIFRVNREYFIVGGWNWCHEYHVSFSG